MAAQGEGTDPHTADLLRTPIEEDEDAGRVAAAWVGQLTRALGDGDKFADLFWEHGQLVSCS